MRDTTNADYNFALFFDFGRLIVTVRKKAKLSVVVSNDKHRTNPKVETLHRIPNYPTKLVIYQLAASPYWWVRYYHNKRILRKSTKETDKRKAIEFAKRFLKKSSLAISHHCQHSSAMSANLMTVC